MSNNNSQDKLINLAMQELAKVLQDMQTGKVPEMSSSMQKLSSELEMANEKRKNMSEDEIKEWAERIATEVSKLEEQ